MNVIIFFVKEENNILLYYLQSENLKIWIEIIFAALYFFLYELKNSDSDF